MSILDITVVSVALETFQRGFDATAAQVAWTMTDYTLALATVIPMTFSPISPAASVGLGTAPAVAVAAGEWWHPAYALAITVAMAAIVLPDGPWPRALEWKPLAWVGGLGYGVYLIHEPVMRFLGSLGALPEARSGAFFVVTGVLVALPSIALAWVSSRTVEIGSLKLLSLIDRNGAPCDYYDRVRTR